MDIQPFHISVPQADLDDLNVRLERTRWPVQVAGTDWERGVPVPYLKRLADYWRDRFDWRAQEARLNALPQFTTDIDGQRLHFVHVRSGAANAVPLLLLHGYPGSVVDFLEVIGPLSDPEAYGGLPTDAFHVVAVSLPGLGLSPRVLEPGWNLFRTTQAVAELMRRLGYERYAVQAGDAGAGVAGMLGGMYSAQVIGIHLNGPEPFPEAAPEELEALAREELSEADRLRLSRMQRFNREGGGYLHIQSTRPATIGYGLHDSPAMQLAWIVEKYKEWTDPAKELPEDALNIDHLLTNVSAYWFTGNGAGAAHFLYENMYPAAPDAAGAWEGDGSAEWGAGEGGEAVQPVPMGVAVFAADNTIRKLTDRSGGVTHWSEFDRGGHFPAMEVPDLYVGDVRDFFRPLRRA